MRFFYQIEEEGDCFFSAVGLAEVFSYLAAASASFLVGGLVFDEVVGAGEQVFFGEEGTDEFREELPS